MNNIVENTWQQVDVFITLGQSNASAPYGINVGLIPTSTNNSLIWLVNNNITSGTTTIQPLEFRVTTGGRYSSIDILTSYWAGQTNKEVYHFKHAKGGAGLNDIWNANTVGGYADRFDEEWEFFVAALGEKKRYPRVICISWIQFEKDLSSNDYNDTLQYFSRWKDLRKRIDNKIGYWNRWICWGPSDQLFSNNPIKSPKVNTFRSIFDYEIGQEGSTFIYNTDALTIGPDQVHFTNISVVDAGLDLFNLVKSIFESYELSELISGGGNFA